MDILKIRTQNLLALAKKYGGLKKLAEACGKSNSYFSQIFSQTRPFTEKFARQIEASLNLESGYFDKPELENDNPQLVSIPEYSIRLSAGNGEEFSKKDIVGYFSIPRNLILAQSGNVEDTCIFTVSGDSMMPLLCDGTKILVDTANKIIIDNKIYAFLLHDKLFIKKLFYSLTNKDEVIVHSENENIKYPDQTISLSLIKIIGKAICSIGNSL